MLVLPSIIPCEPLNVLNLPTMGASGFRWSLSLKLAPISFGSQRLQDSPSGQYQVPKHVGRPSLLLRISPGPGAAIDSPCGSRNTSSSGNATTTAEPLSIPCRKVRRCRFFRVLMTISPSDRAQLCRHYGTLEIWVVAEACAVFGGSAPE